MLYLILLGLPGSGKGTQAHKIEKNFQFVRISTGDILRKMAQENSPFGKKLQSIMKQGKLVDDKTVFEAVQRFIDLNKDKTKGFILDGFPRNIAQADMLLHYLKKNDSSAHILALLLDVEKEIVIERLTGRRTCPACERVYHITFHPSAKGEFCEVCGTKLIQRKDDTRETIEKRLNTYIEQTFPLVNYFQSRGLLHRIPADAPENDVYERIQKTIHHIQNES